MSLPEILKTEIVGRSRLFRIERLWLRFAGGDERVYERLPAGGRAAVIAVAVNDANEVLLIREYAAGFHEHQLSLPKGASELGEDLVAATNRELKEEVGFGARRIRHLKHMTVAPGHMGFTIHAMLATDLYPESLPGDEPEPPEVVPWPVERIPELLADAEFREARAVAALAIAYPILMRELQ